MTTKRTARRPPGGPFKITPEMVAVYATMKKLEREGKGNSEEHNEAFRTLHYRLLGRKPWDVFLDWANCDEPHPGGPRDQMWRDSWASARAIRLALDAALEKASA